MVESLKILVHLRMCLMSGVLVLVWTLSYLVEFWYKIWLIEQIFEVWGRKSYRKGSIPRKRTDGYIAKRIILGQQHSKVGCLPLSPPWFGSQLKAKCGRKVWGGTLYHSRCSQARYHVSYPGYTKLTFLRWSFYRVILEWPCLIQWKEKKWGAALVWGKQEWWGGSEVYKWFRHVERLGEERTTEGGHELDVKQNKNKHHLFRSI